MRRQFVGLLLFVAIGVGPEDGLLRLRIGRDRAPPGKLPVPEPLVDDQPLDGVVVSGLGRHEVQPAVAPFGIDRNAVQLFLERPQALATAGLGVDPPFAALAGHDERIAGVDRAAAGAVVGGAEKLLQELALFPFGTRAGLPDAEPRRRLVALGHPELAIPIYDQAGRIEHAVLHERPDCRPAACAADRPCGLPVGGEHEHLLHLPPHAHIEPALGVGSHAGRPVEPRDDGLDGTRLGIDRDDILLISHHIDDVVADGADEARLLDVDEFLDGPRCAVEHRHEARPVRRSAADEDLAAPGVQPLDAIGLVRPRRDPARLPDATDRQFGRVLARPGNVVAGLGIEPVDEPAAVVHVDDAAVHGHDLRSADAAVGVLPLHIALEVAGDQSLAGFGAGPAEIHLFPVGRAGARHAMIAAPVGGGRAIPGGAAAVAGPAPQPQADAFVCDRLPGVITRRHGLARRPPVGRRQAVPLDLVLPLGEEAAGEQLPGDRAVGGEEVQRYVAVERHREP